MPSVTFINHASVLIQFDGVNILTDPIYSRTVGFVIPRLRRPGIPFKELPRIDLIVISHDHFDHLNLRTLRKLRRDHHPTIVLPEGLGKYGRTKGFSSVAEMKVWQKLECDDVTITCVPAIHGGGRFPWSRVDAQPCGFVLEQNNASVYFAGDTGNSGHFKEIGKRFSLDVALLPIGAYKPYDWFKDIHLNPQTALTAFHDLNAKTLVPIHWGTFKISDEPLEEPPELLLRKAEQLGIAEKIRVLKNGERFSW